MYFRNILSYFGETLPQTENCDEQCCDNCQRRWGMFPRMSEMRSPLDNKRKVHRETSDSLRLRNPVPCEIFHVQYVVQNAYYNMQFDKVLSQKSGMQTKQKTIKSLQWNFLIEADLKFLIIFRREVKDFAWITELITSPRNFVWSCDQKKQHA